MMKKSKLFFVLPLLCGAAIAVGADRMYQCIDEDGHKSFSNVEPSGKKGAKCTPMDLGPEHSPASSSPKPSGTTKVPTPGNFPKVDADTQKSRDSERRRLLQTELESEQRNLEQAKKTLAEQEAVRLGDERNYQKMLDRLEPHKNAVSQHERNIEALKTELSKLR